MHACVDTPWQQQVKADSASNPLELGTAPPTDTAQSCDTDTPWQQQVRLPVHRTPSRTRDHPTAPTRHNRATRHLSSRAVVCASKGAHACPQKSRSGIAAERLRSPSVSAPHRESLARPTGPGLLTYRIVPKVPKVPASNSQPLGTGHQIINTM